ncbi:MAG: hypothetical protein RSE32_03305 [Comamonas sp.]|uniref:hypothetical protein n=1 Tax=Comamonas sp. TaxID=34028 RepID=UPI002FC5D713
MQIHTQNVIILPPNASADALTGMERLMQSIGRAETPAVAGQPDGKPHIGDYWPSQGGFYAGDMRGDDDTVYGLIVADCGDAKDAGRAKWGLDGERDLSQWDGQDNTRRLVNECPAAKLATSHAADEHKDFYLPARRELQLACATVPHLFGSENWYWSSTHYGQSTAWAVDFERGITFNDYRSIGFRVRPVRRFIY